MGRGWTRVEGVEGRGVCLLLCWRRGGGLGILFMQPVLRGEKSSIGRFSWLYWLFMEGFRGRARGAVVWYGMVWYGYGLLDGMELLDGS